jgi:hypothetical protein
MKNNRTDKEFTKEFHTCTDIVLLAGGNLMTLCNAERLLNFFDVVFNKVNLEKDSFCFLKKFYIGSIEKQNFEEILLQFQKLEKLLKDTPISCINKNVLYYSCIKAKISNDTSSLYDIYQPFIDIFLKYIDESIFFRNSLNSSMRLCASLADYDTDEHLPESVYENWKGAPFWLRWFLQENPEAKLPFDEGYESINLRMRILSNQQKIQKKGRNYDFLAYEETKLIRNLMDSLDTSSANFDEESKPVFAEVKRLTREKFDAILKTVEQYGIKPNDLQKAVEKKVTSKDKIHRLYRRGVVVNEMKLKCLFFVLEPKEVYITEISLGEDN